jgi:hypothetical protein
MKLAIVIPTADTVSTDFTMCLTRLVAHLCSVDVSPMIINPRSSLVQKGRWDGVRQALQHGASHILFIDSDQTFPANAAAYLITLRKKIVGATYRLRSDEVAYTARDKHGERIDFSKRKGLHEVASNGLGFTLIDAEVFRKVDEPWFKVEYDGQKWISEDESFFKAASAAGYKVWVDADLTSEVGHVGSKNYI